MEYRIMLEYFHRLAAAVVGVLLITSLVWSVASVKYRRVIAPWIVSAVLLLGVQINLGRLTVTKLLQAEIVAMHLGTAVIIFSLLLLATRRAFYLETGIRFGSKVQASPGFKWAARFAIVVLFLQIMLGGSVSANYAGLACPDFPTCNGLWFPGFSGRVGAQFLHRLGALLATVSISLFLFHWLRRRNELFAAKSEVKLPAFWSGFPCLLGGFLGIQWILGIGMILFGVNAQMQISPVLSVAHLGVGLSLLTLLVCGYDEFRSES